MKPGFATELRVEQVSSSWRLWMLTAPLVYWIDEERAIVVGPDFVTDGASIPRFMWALYPPLGPWARAGVLHDYLCCLQSIGYSHPHAPDRAAADAMFLSAMATLPVADFHQRCLYIGAKLGSWFGVRASMIDNNEKLRGAVEITADAWFDFRNKDA